VKTTRQQALLMVDRAMVRIRRSQSRRTLGRFLQQQLERHFSLAELFVADALQELAEAGEPRPTIGRMAKRLGIEPSRASRMTAAAIRAGLVRRIASQSDGRRSYVELTSEGAKVLELIRRFRMKFFAHFMLNWSNRECADFGRLLIRFTESLPQGFANEERRELRSNDGRETKRQ
jgi:DNA-binding MarR family transcriptional regulator